ncbi:hypothetical protein E3U55_04625 [Filobacillus milosensis]|uniref:Uncharacterized protein n=1 Tax=Filobacillus milosensis TaxID=94137 RepID=A0A4Y8IQM3_9BACI|nr:hypothetical protein [Filobacillus milosensis]TFB23104.1 hypothetical protein E3U55_04625 [Filobacillus milosensis]
MIKLLDVIRIGPLNLYIPHLLSIIAILITSLNGYVLVKKLSLLKGNTAFELVIEYWLTFIVVWKLSYFLLHPQDLISSPLSVIYFNGGMIGVVLGLITVIGFIFMKYKKHFINWKIQTLLFLSAFILYVGINQFFKFIYVQDLLMILEGATYIAIVVVLYLEKSYHHFYSQFRTLRWFLIAWVVFTVIKDEIQLYLIWLLAALVMATTTIFIEAFYNRKENNE